MSRFSLGSSARLVNDAEVPRWLQLAEVGITNPQVVLHFDK